MLKYIRTHQNQPVSMVSINYADFSKNPEDLKDFLKCVYYSKCQLHVN